MKYIVENWFVIVGLIAVLTAGGYAVYVFMKMPSDKQLNKVREWLLYAVTKAEKELGGGTGQIKLRYVYDMFVARFTWLFIAGEYLPRSPSLLTQQQQAVYKKGSPRRTCPRTSQGGSQASTTNRTSTRRHGSHRTGQLQQSYC